MGLVDTLKKWGIIRAGGAAGTYTNAKDRPFTSADDDNIPVTPTPQPKPETTELPPKEKQK